jgi:serine/threonine-protein kinase
MGVVLAATRLEDARPVAIKFVKDVTGPDAERSVRRLVREARATMLLHSPHAVRVLELSATEDGFPFIVMERLEGESLATRLTRGTFEAWRAAHLLAQACLALAEAHGLGLVHRDVTPGNLFLCRTHNADAPFVKMLDFGLAKQPSSLASDVTQGHQIAGSPPYMSPEQVSQGQLDPRSDIWSVGVVLHQMITGGLPFSGKSAADTFAAILTQPPQPVPDAVSVPPSLLSVLARCLRKDPRERVQTAVELHHALLTAATEGSNPGSVTDHADATAETSRARQPWRS